MSTIGSVFTMDEFRCWVDLESIQIKAVCANGDPLDLGTDEVRRIIAALTRMVVEIDGEP